MSGFPLLEIWTKSADDILASIQRFCLRTLQATV
jgi:hypothetical protein